MHARVGTSVQARAYKWTREIYAIPFTDVRIRVRTTGHTPTEIYAVPNALILIKRQCVGQNSITLIPDWKLFCFVYI